jgi:cysteine desulfurase/selenocysteine lyase
MEHHSNIVPWLMLAEEIGLEVRYVPVDGEGRLDLSDLATLMDGVKLVGVSAMSNVLGTINPVAEITAVAHRAGAVVVVDGAQLVPHAPIDVEPSAPTFSPSRATR